MKILYITLGSLAVLLLIGGVFFYVNYLKPINGMQPSGAYHVGVTNFDYEFSSKITGERRKINLKAWYPSHSLEGELDLQQSPKTALAVAKIFGIPEFLASKDQSSSYIDVSIAEDEAHYPVVIFNHGFASFPTQNSVNMQQLASHGYIVLSIAHPDISLVTEYTDGTYVDYDADHPVYKAYANQTTELDVVAKQLDQVLAHAKDIEDFATYWQVMAEFTMIDIYAKMQIVIEQWIEDTSQLADYIAAGEGLKLSANIGSYMSVDKIGLLGHSLGGVTSTFANYSNQNIVAAMSLDAPPIYTTDISSLNFDKSTCHLMSDIVDMGGEKLDFRQINRPMLEKSSAFGCNAIYKGASHMNFADMNYVGLMKPLGQVGKVDQQKMGEELNQMILWYFDKTLKGEAKNYVPQHAEIVTVEMFNE